jgi:protoheme IX farnesyltransferase
MPKTFHQYLVLCKPRVVVLIVFTAVVGMFLSVPGLPPLVPFLAGTLGVALAASSAAAINHLLDRNTDAKMKRTRNRPMAKGELNKKNVLVFALTLGFLAMAILVTWANTLTAILTFLSLIGYWLDRNYRESRPPGAIVIPDYFHLDPTPFLGIGDLP